MSTHQQLSPALEDRQAYLGTVAASYEAAAKLLTKPGCPVADTRIPALVQRLGDQSRSASTSPVGTAPADKEPTRAAGALAVMQLHGFQVRFSRPGSGWRRTQQPAWTDVK